MAKSVQALLEDIFFLGEAPLKMVQAGSPTGRRISAAKCGSAASNGAVPGRRLVDETGAVVQYGNASDRHAGRRLPGRRLNGLFKLKVLEIAESKTATCATTFKAKLIRPAQPGEDASCFLVLPKAASDKLPRRGRTSVEGSINGHAFQATLEPDGQLSHWLKLSQELREAAHAEIGETVTVQILPVDPEPEPQTPDDLQEALAASPAAKAAWQSTTTIARVDWIHWIESAKQAKTRRRRVDNACDMLAAGNKRVCCFDSSGFYSKGLSAP